METILISLVVLAVLLRPMFIVEFFSYIHWLLGGSAGGGNRALKQTPRKGTRKV